MDYSNFYHDWLQIDLAQGETPNYYQILGLNNMEPDVQKIEDAFRNTLERLQNVNGMANPEAYTAIMSQVLEAHKVFIEPKQKHDYDLRLSADTGERVWKGYERPSLLTRVRQMSLITLSFMLGCGVMFAMAFSVDRNPDGSIIFREEVQSHKVPPFASQLNYVVYRPSIARDYQPNGYTVTVNKPVPKTESLQASASPETNASKKEEQDSLLSGLDEGLNSQTTQSELDEFSQILSGETEAADSEAAPKADTPAPKAKRRSSIYKLNTATNSETSANAEGSANADLEGSEALEVEETPEAEEAPETTDVPEAAEAPKTEEFPEVVEEDSPNQETVLSLATVTELLEKVRSNLDLSKPGANEAYVLLQYQTLTEILQKLCEAEGTLDPEEATKFTDYTLNVVTNLGWEKHFKEAFELCEILKTFNEKKEMAALLNDGIDQRCKTVQNYQTLYNNSLKMLKQLQENPNDPKLNTRYAMWLWQETGDMQESIPYLAKCEFKAMRDAAIYEMEIPQNEASDRSVVIRNAADKWWNVATLLKSDFQISIVKEHAKKLYLKVDSNDLNDDQKERVANL